MLDKFLCSFLLVLVITSSVSEKLFLGLAYQSFKVSILNGIVMGGGAGASIHGRFRVATENSVCTMSPLISSFK